jgi:hypothetical protein
VRTLLNLFTADLFRRVTAALPSYHSQLFTLLLITKVLLTSDLFDPLSHQLFAFVSIHAHQETPDQQHTADI